jgi:hypothetical protein
LNGSCQHLDLVAAAPLFGHAIRHDAIAVRGADAAMVISTPFNLGSFGERSVL